MTTTKPKTGKLIREFPNGRTVVLEENKPFPLLQLAKKRYIQQGVKKENLRITY